MTIAIHWILEIFVLRVAIMTRAVMNVTPLLVNWIVPGSANL